MLVWRSPGSLFKLLLLLFSAKRETIGLAKQPNARTFTQFIKSPPHTIRAVWARVSGWIANYEINSGNGHNSFVIARHPRNRMPSPHKSRLFLNNNNNNRFNYGRGQNKLHIGIWQKFTYSIHTVIITCAIQ